MAGFLPPAAPGAEPAPIPPTSVRSAFCLSCGRGGKVGRGLAECR